MDDRRTIPDEKDASGEKNRRVPEMALGLVLVIGGALGALLLYRSGTESATVVASTHLLSRGHVVSSLDLEATEVAGSAAQYFVQGSDAQSLIGKALTVDVSAHMPLSAMMVSDNRPLQASEALTSAAVDVGNYPTELAPGDMVRVVLAPQLTMSAATDPRMFENIVTVWSIKPPESFSDHAVITLRGPLELAIAVAGAGQVHVVLVGNPIVRDHP